MPKHTPGPWRIVARGQFIQAPRRPDSRRLHDVDICRVESNELELAGEFEANGRLIAAAPDLLEACQEMLNKAQSQLIRHSAWFEKIEAIVARATGG